MILLLLLTTSVRCVRSWVSKSRTRTRLVGISTTKPFTLTSLESTPFEAGFYYDNNDKDDDEDDTDGKNPFQDDWDSDSSLAITDPDTPLVVGVNKYTHDTALCVAHAVTGDILWALSKERLSRKKHDAGNIVTLVEECLECLDLHLENIKLVVTNNHHHRALPLERSIRHMEWESGLEINGGYESGYEEPENTLPDAEHYELSHHLAHAYSTATQAPFDHGMCVVMDGMGETYRTMAQAVLENDNRYTSDVSFGMDTFQCIPSNIAEMASASPFDYREAESVYVFRKNHTARTMDLWPVFKRFTAENSPPALYNHGFENMESVGAVYSRASSHIFGDWNSCGKVMGLAPWATHTWTDDAGVIVSANLHQHPIMSGSLYMEGTDALKINRTLLEGMPLIARNDPDLFDTVSGTKKKRYDFDDDDTTTTSGKDGKQRVPLGVALEAIAIAHSAQMDLEHVVMDFVRHFKEKYGESNLCLAGGVALNSVLNGRLARELGFEQTFISPYPGDDGIAIGCCAFGLFGNQRLGKSFALERPPSLWKQPCSPYLGPDPSRFDIKEAIDQAAPWLEVECVGKEEQRLEIMAREIESGGVVAWYRSRSELGPRALGHRSILADPRKKGLVRFINEHVKKRESFRPFAPSVLAEEVNNWFEVSGDGNISPYMSMTAFVRKEKRNVIPAVTHVDGSSRLQTVTERDEPMYYRLIRKFFRLTGVPLVLNTSFNTLPAEPIVETPSDAIRSFLYGMGSIELLVLDDYVIKRKRPDLRSLLGEASKSGDVKIEPAYPKRAGLAKVQSSFTLEEGTMEEGDVPTTTRVFMPDRPIHGKGNEWFELLDDLEGELLSACDGSVTLNEILAYYTAYGENRKLGDEEVKEAEIVLQNIVHRLVRLYEHTLIGW